MKKLILLLLIVPVLVIAQGEQRYADGTATDQDGNTFEWINYGTQDWSIENAEVVAYRDGTAIPQVTDDSVWENLTTGAWCYFDNDPTKGKLYNWYALVGVHDNDENTANKEFAPEGWHVPTDEEWTTLENYLIANGYNYDGTTTGNKIGKSIASNTGWTNWLETSMQNVVGSNQSTNNTSGFNLFPVGTRTEDGHFGGEWDYTNLWSSDLYKRNLDRNRGDLERLRAYIYSEGNTQGLSVRFVRNASTASTNNYSNAITIYPNPTTSIVNLQGGKEYDIEVYDMAGNKVMALTGNKIDMSHLSSATYIVKALDKVENEEVSYKVVKN